MKLTKIFDRGERERPKLLTVTPPRSGERTLLGVENMLQSIAIPEPFTLELAGDADGVSLLARCRGDEVVEQQLRAHYPQAFIEEVTEEDDPLRLDEGEQAWSTTLGIDGPEFLPLRVFRDDDMLDAGSDPLIALIGSLSNLREGERVVARLCLRSLGPDWSQAYLEKAHKPAVQPPRDSSYSNQVSHHQSDFKMLVVLGIAALPALQGYLWVRNGETWKAVLLGMGIASGLAAAGWVWHRWKQARSRVYDPVLIKEKTSRVAFEAALEVTAVLPPDGREERARKLLDNVAAAYRHYDNAAGSRFRVGKVRPAVPDSGVNPPRRGLLQSRNVLGVREAASLWHPPGPGDDMPLVERSGSKVLLPSARGVKEGALVGASTGGAGREIRFSPDLMRRHHLYVARTRMGKSTLMQHVVVHKMREKAAGRDDDAIVVVDPHADLVKSLLRHVPESIIDRVRLIDLADEERTPGINLLDTAVFSDRDRTADSVVRICKGLWVQWGPRMQSILEHTVKTLHEVNEGPSVDRNGQYTILDGSRLLSEKEFRDDVLRKVRDPYILRWWAEEFGKWPRHLEADALAPVQTRLAYYSSSKRARAVLGQPRSTIDLRRVIADGGILFVSTAQGDVGRDVSSLVGASLMNLIDAVIREQGSLPPDKRRGVTVVVDEMQAMNGVDYESMLGELGKFGASLFLATQGLDKLDDLSPTLRGTLLSNVGCLAVFQVAAEDARLLAWELGKDRVSEDDIISQAVHHCYVRATVGEDRLPAFSMKVRGPEKGRPEVAARVEAGTVDYTSSPEEMAAREAKAERLVEQFRAELEALKEEDGGAPTQPEKTPAAKQTKRRRRRKGQDRSSNGTGNNGTTNEADAGTFLRSQEE